MRSARKILPLMENCADFLFLCTIFLGLITGPALKRFSPRQVAIVGSILSGTGLILSAMSTQLWHVIIAYGFLVGTMYNLFENSTHSYRSENIFFNFKNIRPTNRLPFILGLGLGFINPSSFLAVNSYFTTKRGSAVGLALAGTGLGQMIMPYIVRLLLDQYGFRGTALIMGALALNGVIGASLFQPVEWHMKKVNDNCNTEKKMLLQPCRHSANKHTYRDITDAEYEIEDEDIYSAHDTTSLNSEIVLIRKPNWKEKLSKAMDLQLLRDPVFISICIGLSLAYTASINFSMLFPYFLQVRRTF